MTITDKQYLEQRRAFLRDHAEQVKTHFVKYPASVADVQFDVFEYELVLEIFREVLEEKQLKRCRFVKVRD